MPICAPPNATKFTTSKLRTIIIKIFLSEIEKVGHITRCCYSPRLEHNIALVNLPVDLAEPGTAISLDIGGEWREATVCAIPWFTSIKKLPQVDG